ncbi:nitroreductase family deazaflavin-dependent oxidoreductase [Fodinicola feengrottensis]|nr:nitroreductase family deazaflavin-dependent oxidoreductase [Fodinicola feengrottensis]
MWIHRILSTTLKLGITMRGMKLLYVRGRKSGELRTAVVGPLRHEGQLYLVAPRGNTQWVRNLRAAGEGQLRLGFKTEEFTATELADAEKPPVLRPYLKIWKEDTGFFNNTDHQAPEARLLEIAPNHPVFRIEIAQR